MRKRPTQSRAIERVDRILDATDRAIAERGVAAVTMSDIAIGAAVPIGSVYQYFTNRDELLKSLCDRHYALLGERLGRYFVDVRTIADFTRDLRETLNLCWTYSRENPGYNALSLDPHAWTVLREADWQDSLINARRMAETLEVFIASVPRNEVLALCTIVCDSASSTARLASRFPEMRDDLFDQLVEMVESRIYSMLRENTVIERARSASGPSPLGREDGGRRDVRPRIRRA